MLEILTMCFLIGLIIFAHLTIENLEDSFDVGVGIFMMSWFLFGIIFIKVFLYDV
jgi:hypothetical protein